MRAPAVVALVGNADKVPQDLGVATYQLTDGSKVELCYDAYLFLAEHITKGGKRRAFIDDKQRVIVPTARTLAPFKRLKIGMYHVDVDALVGKADKDEENELDPNIHTYGYKLSDGSLVWIRFDNSLTSIQHQLKNGQKVDLIKVK